RIVDRDEEGETGGGLVARRRTGVETALSQQIRQRDGDLEEPGRCDSGSARAALDAIRLHGPAIPECPLQPAEGLAHRETDVFRLQELQRELVAPREQIQDP